MSDLVSIIMPSYNTAQYITETIQSVIDQTCLTVMYDRKKIGLVQIADIKKNNDYAIWLKICKKTRCYLLDEVLAEYRRGRSGSISTHGYKELIKWHYRLFRFAEKENPICSLVNTIRNMTFGLYKKKRYVKKNRK